MASRGSPSTSSDAALLRSLERAIIVTPSKDIREPLVELVHTDGVVLELVKKRLMSTNESMSVSRYLETCKNCQTTYIVAENERKTCTYLPGEKEVGESGTFWADHDDDHHGAPKDHIDDPNFAEGFVWNCCDELGDAQGCVRHVHEPEERSRKRVRVVTRSLMDANKSLKPRDTFGNGGGGGVNGQIEQ